MMKRGTPPAILFGKALEEIRTKKTMVSASEVARRLGDGFYSSSIRQFETAQRAVNTKNVPSIAKALEVNAVDLALLKKACEGYIYKNNKLVFCDDLEELKEHISFFMDQMVPEIECVLPFEILSQVKETYSIVRPLRGSVKKETLERLISQLSANERDRVLGYIEALLNNREYRS